MAWNIRKASRIAAKIAMISFKKQNSLASKLCTWRTIQANCTYDIRGKWFVVTLTRAGKPVYKVNVLKEATYDKKEYNYCPDCEVIRKRCG